MRRDIFRLSEARSWTIAAAMALLLPLCAALFARKEFVQPTSHLLLGALPVYVFATNVACLRMASWLAERVALRRTVVALTSIALLVGASWLAFGAYFVTTARHGFESDEHLGLHFVLQKTLHLQFGLLPLLCVLLVPAGRRFDSLVSVAVVVLFAAFANF